MKPNANPLGLPEETLPQTTADPPSTHDPSGTMAAPADYTPSGVMAATTRGMNPGPVAVSPVEHLGMAGRYALLRALAKGGMGQVSVARDTELDRDVALKEIQQKFKLDGATLHRFTLEARVTGKLEHPGVVPVYGLGTYPDGRPYYAMRFITGNSFQAAIDEFHEKELPGRDLQERSLALRQLLRRFIDVCNTIGYAHSRGILHRDIKPANVMLGKFGETLVVDWGLAKEMFDGAAQPPPMSDETSLNLPVTAADFVETQEGFTLYGQTMGTPAYMSPEQAAGKWDITGVASDVYSLGATLYAILSGTPPYSGPSFEVITKVQRGEYKPVKQVKTNVAGPLDAIVQKAMAFEIKERYPNALALAADVDRWLADEPVSCYPEPFSTRAWRWVRRNRTFVAVASAVSLAATIALAVGLVAVNAERKRTNIARLEAIDSRGEARDALLALTDGALGEILAGSERPTPQQKKYLNSLIGMYQKFAAREPESPESKYFIAGAWYRIGRLQARVEEYPQALQAYSHALAILNDPQVAVLPGARSTRGDVELYSGILDLQQAKPEAEAWLQASIVTFRALVAEDPRPEYRFRLSQAQDRLGSFCYNRARFEEAAALFKESLALRESLAKEAPADQEYQFRLAQSMRQLGGAVIALGQREEGLQYFTRARSVQQKLADENPTVMLYLALLADIDSQLAVHHTPARPVEPLPDKPNADSLAVTHARLAVRTWGRIVALNPGDTKFRQQQADANITLARQCQDNNQLSEARLAIDTALSILRVLDAEEPGNRITQIKLAQALVGLETVLRLAGDPNARTAAAEAVTFTKTLATKDTTSAAVYQHAATALLEQSLLQLKLKKTSDAKADIDAAWSYVQSAATLGNAFAVHYYSRATADWMLAADNYDAITKTSETIASLKLPKGAAWFEAACLHGRVADQLLKQSDLDDEWRKFAGKQLGEAIHCLKMAVTNGYDRADLMIDEPDLQQLRPTPEFLEVVESLRAKPKAGRVEN